MITNSTEIKHHDELIKSKGILCTSIEAGNPFFSNQDLVLSAENFEPEEVGESCNFTSVQSFDEKAVDLIRESLMSSINRAHRLPKSLDAANAVALDYLRIGEIENAITEFKKILAIDSGFFPALANLAKSYSIKGNFDAALNVYMDFEKKNIEDERILVNLGLICLVKRDFDRALEYLMKAHRIKPENPSILNNIGLIHLTKRNLNKAISFVRKASRIRNDDPATYNNLGVCFVAQRNYRKATKNFKIAYLLNKNAKNIVSNLANAYQKVGEHENVISLLNDYLQSHPEEIGLRDIFARSLFQAELYHKCLDQLKIILRNVNPDDNQALSTVFNNMGVVYTHIKDVGQAKECLIKSIDLAPNNNIGVYYNLLNIYFQLWGLENARTLIDKAISIYDDRPRLLSYLGTYHHCIGDYETAKRILQGVVEADPTFISPYLDLSVIEMDIYEDYDSALKILEKGLCKHPDSIPLINNYAYCLILRGELSKARAVLDRHKEDSDVALCATRGLLLIKEGNIEEGRRYYNRSVALAGKNKDLVVLIEQKKNLELGIYYLGRGNKREAKRLLRKGLKYKAREDRYQRKIVNLLNQWSGD